jgi:DNA-binding NtrC family response regulator
VRTLAPRAHAALAALSFAGQAPLTRRLREQLPSVAALRCPVLITGELGSGRTRAARWLHALGPAPAAPFLALHGAPPLHGALPGEGTLLLPELAALPVHAQAEWRAWLDARPPRLRLVATAETATPPLPADRTLFEALRRVELRVPTLRERRDDLAALAADIARELADEIGVAPFALSAEGVRRIARTPWIACALDLRRLLERLAASATRGAASGAQLEAALAELRPSVSALRERSRAREREALLAALTATGGNVTRAARSLGRSRAALYRLIEKHGVALGPDRSRAR